jgi:hypothetical protein
MMGVGIGINSIRSQDTQMSSSNFSDRVDLVKHVFASVVIISMIMLSFVGAMYIKVRREIHNSATCDETCAVVDLHNMHQTDSCWCGDDLHSDRVIPLAWEFKEGEIKPTVKTIELEVGN